MLRPAALGVAAILLTATLGVAGTAAADTKPPRASGGCSDSGSCLIKITDPGTPGHRNPGGLGGSGDTGGGNGTVTPVGNNAAAQAGTAAKIQVPTNPTDLCSYMGGGWVPTNLGYLSHCVYPQGGPKAPAARKAAKGAKAPAAPTYTPGQAATVAISQLQISKPKIGSAPCTRAGCKGTVGVPVWLWTQPWQTQTATATLGPYTVTATASITQVTWALGDGTSVTCDTAGTAYDVSMGWVTSPDCGIPTGYQAVGTYTIQAAATWRVSWSGATSGSQTLTATTTSNPIPVGEYQAVVVGG